MWLPCPADDSLDKPLEFNERLIANPTSTFRAPRRESMSGAGLFPGDVAVVALVDFNNSASPSPRHSESWNTRRA